MTPARTLHLATTEQGNRLLARDPLSLLVGMLLDQQIPMEKAFTSPAVLLERMNAVQGTRKRTLDASVIAGYDADAFETIFRTPPALHRFPAANAKRVQAAARVVLERYGGQVERLWLEAADGTDLVARVADLPGFGTQKARIFAALLGKQFDVRPDGWREAAGNYGEDGSFRSVADVVDAPSLQKVRTTKQQAKAAAKATATAG